MMVVFLSSITSSAIMVMVCTVALLVAIPSSSGLQVRTTAPITVRGSGLRTARSYSSPRHHLSWLRQRSSSGAAPYSSTTTTTLNLLKGLVPSVDDDINRELEEASLSGPELFRRELDEGASILAAIRAVTKRRKDKSGDYENKYKILSDYRSYSNRELLDTDHLDVAPVLDDLNQVQPSAVKTLWVSSPYRLAVFLGAFFSFPILCNILNSLVEVSADEFDIINDQFTPGIGILYGTFVALTLDILYERQGKVQENASVEASLLSQVTQNVLNLFRDNEQIAREATQIIADQVRIIVYRARGAEMLNIMRADPYARLLSIVDHYQRDKTSFTPQEEALIDGLRGEIPALMEARAKRLSDEASALPPTHFLVLLLLTALSLVGFTAATLTITDADGKPPLESRMVFAGLSAVYVLFFNFCKDMNDPFDGVYQIKRSSAASYLLQIKWLIANQPFGKDIKFDTRGLEPTYDGNEVFEVGNGPKKTESESPPPKEGTKPHTDETPAALSMETLAPAGNSRLREMEAELERLKQLNQQIHNGQASAASIAQVPAAENKVNGDVTKEISAKEFLPERKAKPSSDATLESQSKATQADVASQFESTSGFSGDKSQGGSGGGVTVPQSSRPVDKQKVSMYFRKAGGFDKK